jgi:diguanylate cyclase (GGDEF)-like protein
VPFRRSSRDSGIPSIADDVNAVFGRVIAMIVVLAFALAAVFGYLIGSIRPDQQRYRAGAGALALAHAGMIDEESALRGYLLLRDPALLVAYRDAAATVANEYAALNGLLASDRRTAPSLLTMRVAGQAWESEWAHAVATGAVPTDRRSLTAFYARGSDLFGTYRTAEVALGERLQVRRDALNADQDRMLASGLALTVVLAVVVVALAVRQRRRLEDAVVEPVGAIVSTTEAIARLDLDTRLEPSGPEEFRRIGEGLMRMRDALAESLYHELAAQERIEAQAGQLRTILAMSREISGSLDLGAVLGSVATAVTRVSGFPRTRVWLTDQEAGHVLTCVYDSRAEHGMPEEDLTAALGTGAVGQAVRYGRMTSADESGEPDVDFHTERSLATVAVPLVVGGRISGALELSGPKPVLFTADSAEVLTTLASQAAAAIEAASLHAWTAELAHTDGLTGLANRRRLDRDLDLECERAARYGRPLALIMFDVDHFKRLNDTYGHAHGDEVLRQLAAVVTGAVRSTDTVYRYGGEEFAVLAREAGSEDARALAERLRSQVEEHFATRGSWGQVTASFGLGLVPPTAPVPGEVVAAADAALYRSKTEGRNRVSGPLDGARQPPAEDGPALGVVEDVAPAS